MHEVEVLGVESVKGTVEARKKARSARRVLSVGGQRRAGKLIPA